MTVNRGTFRLMSIIVAKNPRRFFTRRHKGGEETHKNCSCLVRDVPNVLVMFSENLREDFLAVSGKRG